MTVVILRGDAAHLPMADGSVDLIVTSPPYFSLRSYTDGGEAYDGQIGSEYTPWQYLDALWGCTADWVRVLKPGGSIFVNLGDKYSTYTGANWGNGRSLDGHRGRRKVPDGGPVNAPEVYGVPYKSLMGLPWRYAIGCIDRLGLVLRAEIIWDKPNGMPESATDRVRRSHEQVFHLVKPVRQYFSAVDEIREPTPDVGRKAKSVRAGPLAGSHGSAGHDGNGMRMAEVYNNPLGRAPGSVWSIPSLPLVAPARLGVSHFAAYPPELCRRIILGWSPSGICTECGEGRFPVADRTPMQWRESPAMAGRRGDRSYKPASGTMLAPAETRILGYACSCTPYTDHPGTGGSSGDDGRFGDALKRGDGYPRTGYSTELHARPRVGPWREYHLEGWTPPPARPAIVLDPFAGTGTTMLTASVLGRIGVGVDRSMDYCRLARWRTSDPGERARALGVPKPPPIPEGQGSLFDQAS